MMRCMYLYAGYIAEKVAQVPNFEIDRLIGEARRGIELMTTPD